MPPPIRVLIADDHGLFRKELRQLLERLPDIEVVGDAANGDEALDAIHTIEFDVAILDLDMPGIDGLELARAIHMLRTPGRVVLLTAHKSIALVRKALQSGVTGYVLKDDALTELLDAVEAVHRGGTYFSPQLAPYIPPQIR